LGFSVFFYRLGLFGTSHSRDREQQRTQQDRPPHRLFSSLPILIFIVVVWILHKAPYIVARVIIDDDDLKLLMTKLNTAIGWSLNLGGVLIWNFFQFFESLTNTGSVALSSSASSDLSYHRGCICLVGIN